LLGLERLGVPLRGLTDEGLRRVIYVNIFPNVLISLHPDYVMAHTMRPLGPGRTHVVCEWLFEPETIAEAVLQLITDESLNGVAMSVTYGRPPRIVEAPMRFGRADPAQRQ